MIRWAFRPTGRSGGCIDKGKWNEWARKIISALKKYKYAALVLVIGLALMLIPFGSEKKQTKQQQTPSEPAAAEQQDYAQEMEARLTKMLLQIDGAGRVSVMLTLQTGAQTQYQTDTKITSEQTNSGTQTSEERKTVILSEGSAYDEAAISSVVYPQFQGALIVSEGADNAAVRWNIVSAVSSLTGLGTDKITVVKMK